MEVIQILLLSTMGMALLVCGSFVWFWSIMIPDGEIRQMIRTICIVFVLVGLILGAVVGHQLGRILNEPLTAARTVPA